MSHIFLSINNNDTITALISKIYCIMLYSTTAADVLASLELDLKKVNVESGVFIIEFQNLTVSYIWLLICSWYFSFLQRFRKNV